MAYEVTATRRRPQRLEDLVGQDFVAATLKNSIENGRIAHAYLFSGPRGCGKTSTARILAKALNCQKGPTATPCGECENCLEIARGTNTDVIEIDGASNTSVNDVRQIKDEVLFPPQSSKYKIYIIDEVHMLSTSAFNALLKTIEEPPPYVIFIFATTELQKVPATIKSRCQQFNFRLVPIEQVKNLLADAASEIGIQADDEALYWIARESTGSIRDAYTLFDQVAAFSDNHITYEKIRDKLGLVGVDRLNEIFEKCAGSDAAGALGKLDEFLQAGISIEQLISNSTDYLRSLLLIKSGITKEALLGQSPDRFSKVVLDSWSPVQLERGVSLLFQLYRDIRYSLSPRFELELAFSRLSWLSSYVSPAEVKAALDKAKNLLMSGAGLGASTGSATSVLQGTPVATEQPQVQQQPPRPTFQFSALQNQGANPSQFSQPSQPNQNPFYNGGAVPPQQTASFAGGGTSAVSNATMSSPEIRERVLADLVAKEPLLGSALMQAENWTFDGQTLSVTAPNGFLKQQLSSQSQRVSAIVSEVLGQAVNFLCLEKTVPVNVQQSVASEKEYPQEIKVLLSIFHGEVIGKTSTSTKAPEPVRTAVTTTATDADDFEEEGEIITDDMTAEFDDD